jgi:hypothetical protein
VDAPLLYKPHPALFPMTLLGGFTGTVLLTALLRLASSSGTNVVDLPALLGGVFSDDPGTVFAAGHGLFVATGVLVLPLVLGWIWSITPGDRFSFPGSLVKGSLFAVGLFGLVGLLLPLLGALSKPAGVGVLEPGPFALELGPVGPLQLLLGSVVYALPTALVSAMARGMGPMDAVGWGWWSHGSGESP